MIPRSLFALLALAVAASFMSPKTTEAKGAARHVVLITLDGFGSYNLDDPKVSLPNLRKMAGEGVRADGMSVITPSVTWPDHTTLVTGVTPARHSVIANGIIEPGANGRLTINPRHSKEEMCKVPTVYDLAHEAGLKTAEINWPVTRDAPTLDFRFPDHPDAVKYSTPELLDELDQIGLFKASARSVFSFAGSVRRDEIWTGAAAHLLRAHKPNLLLLHLLNTDGVQHAHGPNSNEAHTALSLADRQVGDVLEAIKDAGIEKRTAVIVTADHGFIRVTKQIQTNARLTRLGLGADAYCISEGGVDYVYVPKAAQQPEVLAKVRQALETLEGIAAVYEPKDYAALGFPTQAQSPQAPQLLLDAKDGYAFSNTVDGEDIVTLPRATGTHGYVHTNPKMDAVFVARGAGLRAKSRLRRIRNVDVAPTIARLLGLRMEKVEGSPLDQVLR